MTRCEACHGVIGAHENPHWFGGTTRYHPGCCPACTVPDARVDRGVPEPALVERMKRGHRRGTPRSWALVGRGS